MKLFFRKYGEGPPLIILHGLYGSSDNWVSIARELASSFTVYLPDQRNHGLSPHSSIHTYSSLRDDLFELVSDLKLRKFFLAGHSMGGRTAMAFALKWPEMLNGLLVADITPFNNKLIREWETKLHRTILDAMLSIDLKNFKNRKDVESVLASKINSKREIELIMKNLQRTNNNLFVWKINITSLMNNISSIMEGIELDNSADNQINGFPVIFVKGEKSDYLPKSHFNDILKLFPSAEFINIQNAGHWIHSEKPDEIVKYIRSMLG
jgi:esterase